jgi:hypothetical protein
LKIKRLMYFSGSRQLSLFLPILRMPSQIV